MVQVSIFIKNSIPRNDAHVCETNHLSEWLHVGGIYSLVCLVRDLDDKACCGTIECCHEAGKKYYAKIMWRMALSVSQKNINSPRKQRDQ